jgi:hypothetical protein
MAGFQLSTNGRFWVSTEAFAFHESPALTFRGDAPQHFISDALKHRETYRTQGLEFGQFLTERTCRPG